MPYIVNNSDGSLTVTVADNTVDTTTYSLALVGRNVSNYGQFFAQNTIRHLENFADTIAPSPSVRLIGQLWFDKNEEVLRVWDGSAWKRATNNVVDQENQRPTSGLVGGEGFFNLTTKTLQIYNGSDWQNASYPGDVTTEFANDDAQGKPAFYGSRLRNIFLKESNSSEIHPVLALVYVNSGTNNVGKTQDVEPGQDETIMALFSDVDFFIDSTGSPNNITYYSELVAAGGIASNRPGRDVGRLIKGMNVRADAESSSIATAETLFVTNIGDASNRVSKGWFNEIDISSSILINGAANVTTLAVSSTSTFDGDITATGAQLSIADIVATGTANINAIDATTGDFDTLVVNNNSVLNGNTVINGNLTVNGVDTQSIGSSGNVIEDYFGNNITTANIVVESSADITGDLTVTGNTTLATANVTGLLEVQSLNVSGATSFANLSVNTVLANISGTTGTFTGNVSAGFFVGTATQAQYADLAEIYAADADYAPGTVVKIGGEAEITVTEKYADTDAFGVISTDPAYLMNSSAQGLPVALQGRVPVRVTGAVKKGQRLVSSDQAGIACAFDYSQPYDPRFVIGRALEDKNSQDVDVVEAVIGVK